MCKIRYIFNSPDPIRHWRVETKDGQFWYCYTLKIAIAKLKASKKQILPKRLKDKVENRI